MVKVITQHEIAEESLDHKFPCGVFNDNSASHELVHEIMSFFTDSPKVLDIGCAGGQFVIDCNAIGCVAVGIEGSNVVSTDEKANGYLNWQEYKNKYLFHANATKEYSIIDIKTNDLMKFDLISAWEVIEHIEENDLEMFFEQIHKHLSDSGIFIGTISVVTCYDPNNKIDLHRTVKPKEWWHEYLSQKFEICEYPFNSLLREVGYYNFSICMRKK